MRSADIRTAYLRYFEERGHRVIPSSSLVPQNDPTLLFTNSGMVQFKDALLGRDVPSYHRAVSCQRCVRAGGKHNDLENVGYTARHLTMFEMLGNFSFGDYFKEEAIAWAWEFIVETLKLDLSRIWVSVHPDDHESRKIWKRIAPLPEDRIVDVEANFWAMAETGPCGRNSEIFYDQGSAFDGGPPGSPEEDGDRFLEFWNLVFPQFDRSADGHLDNLASPGVDTGMGLERVAAIMQQVPDNYSTDLFQPIVASVCELANIDTRDVAIPASVKVIADHVRSASFLVSDGVMPSNEDRGYVLRRIIRRALRHGHKLGLDDPFFHRLVPAVVDSMGGAYPEIGNDTSRIASILEEEEQRFAETLGRGMKLLDAEASRCSGKLSGAFVFRLYDTYGFPYDLTADVARERGLVIDEEGFRACMDEQRTRARAAAKFDASAEQTVHVDGAVEFSGYQELESVATAVALFSGSNESIQETEKLEAGTAGIVVLDRTPMYAEAGGQIGDSGTIASQDSVFRVEDTKKAGVQSLHHGTVESGTLRVGDRVRVRVDQDRRERIARNHSATHLLHAALKEILGSQVSQKGSLVAPDRLRFDFSHSAPLTHGQIDEIEQRVNAKIFSNSEVSVTIKPFDDAIRDGAVALFGEQYGDDVRVLSMGDGFSVELCGGTHVARTGDIGMFKIISESGIAAGVRRVEALTGRGLLEWINQQTHLVRELCDLYNTNESRLLDRVANTMETRKQLEKKVEKLNAELVEKASLDWSDKATQVGKAKVLAVEIGPQDDAMAVMDQVRSRLGTSVVVVAQIRNDKASLACGVSKSIAGAAGANQLISHLAGILDCKGGGSPTMARAGGGNPHRLQAALDSVTDWVHARLDPPA